MKMKKLNNYKQLKNMKKLIQKMKILNPRNLIMTVINKEIKSLIIVQIEIIMKERDLKLKDKIGNMINVKKI